MKVAEVPSHLKKVSNCLNFLCYICNFNLIVSLSSINKWILRGIIDFIRKLIIVKTYKKLYNE